jgi:antitoxin VapB
MALNIKNREVENLASELAHLTGESKTETIRQALLERKARLRFRVSGTGRKERTRRFLEREVWSRIPTDQLGRAPTKKEREKILGYGTEGV